MGLTAPTGIAASNIRGVTLISCLWVCYANDPQKGGCTRVRLLFEVIFTQRMPAWKWLSPHRQGPILGGPTKGGVPKGWTRDPC